MSFVENRSAGYMFMVLPTSIFMVYDRWASYPDLPIFFKIFYNIVVDFPSGLVWPVTWPVWYFTTYHPDSWLAIIFLAIGSLVEVIVA